MDPAGSQAWSRQADILLGLTVGEPPDPKNPAGQNQGLTGFSPRALQDSGFAPFLATLRAAMRHAGGIRIDHAVGLARLWVIPEGAPPAEGAWLNFPVVDLLRLLALESVRHDVVVIGAAGQTEPEGLQETLAQSGIHGMRVLWRERDAETGFVPSRGWGSTDVAMTSTHDLPTVAGWWKGNDIDTGEGERMDTASWRRPRCRCRSFRWRIFWARRSRRICRGRSMPIPTGGCRSAPMRCWRMRRWRDGSGLLRRSGLGSDPARHHAIAAAQGVSLCGGGCGGAVRGGDGGQPCVQLSDPDGSAGVGAWV
jgi:hypothetical protein